jgi:hypothetical protein
MAVPNSFIMEWPGMRTLCLRFVVVLVGAVAIACGSSTGPSNGNNPGSNGSGVFTATVDGQSFVAGSTGLSATPSSAVPGSVVLSGTQLSGTSTTTLSLLLGFLSGPGTYPLGVNQSTTPGGTLLVQTTSTGAFGNFSTGFSGAAGTVTITALTSTQIIGTFQATVPPQLGQSGASKTVTNGTFNMTMTGFVAATSVNPGSTLQATLGGTPFNGATVTGTGSGGAFSIVATTTSSGGTNGSVSMVTTQTVSAGSSFPFQPPAGGGASVVVSVVQGAKSFGGGGPGDLGSVTIASISGGFVKGIFSGTLGGASGSLSITGGAFNIKIQ